MTHAKLRLPRSPVPDPSSNGFCRREGEEKMATSIPTETNLIPIEIWVHTFAQASGSILTGSVTQLIRSRHDVGILASVGR